MNHLKTIDLSKNEFNDKEIIRLIDTYKNDNFFNQKINIDNMFKELKELMWVNVGIIRNKEKLIKKN